MYQILLPVDSDENRARRAANAVRSLPGDPSDQAVVILNVFEEFEAVDESVVSSEDLFAETDYPDSVDTVADMLERDGYDVTRRREHGDPVTEIRSVAAEIDTDVIAISGRKRSPTGKVLFGSVTQSLLLSADRPIIVTMEE